MINFKKIIIDTLGSFYSINITDLDMEFVESTGISNGNLNLFYQHTTCSVLVYE